MMSMRRVDRGIAWWGLMLCIVGGASAWGDVPHRLHRTPSMPLPTRVTRHAYAPAAVGSRAVYDARKGPAIGGPPVRRPGTLARAR
jgi:hypothetical protein